MKRKTTYRHAPSEADRLHPRHFSTARLPSNVEQEDKEVGMTALGKPPRLLLLPLLLSRTHSFLPVPVGSTILQINRNLYEESQGAAGATTTSLPEAVEFEFCTPLQVPRLGRLLEHNTRPHHQLSEARLLDDAGDEHELVTRSRIFRSRLCRDMVVADQRCVVANNLMKSTVKEAKGRKVDTLTRTTWVKMLGPDQELADFKSAQLVVGRGLDFWVVEVGKTSREGRYKMQRKNFFSGCRGKESDHTTGYLSLHASPSPGYNNNFLAHVCVRERACVAADVMQYFLAK